MYHEWECPDCGHGSHRPRETLKAIENLAQLWTTATGDGPAAITRRAAGHDILQTIENRLEQQRVMEENELADKRFRDSGK